MKIIKDAEKSSELRDAVTAVTSFEKKTIDYPVAAETK